MTDRCDRPVIFVRRNTEPIPIFAPYRKNMVKSLVTHHYRTATFPLASLPDFKRTAFEWAQSFSQTCYLDSNEYSADLHRSYECLIGADACETISLPATGNAFDRWKQFCETHPTWQFGYLSYDLKNEVEALQSAHPDRLGFPVLHFFVPVYVLEVFTDRVIIHSRRESPRAVWQLIRKSRQRPASGVPALPSLRARTPRQEYLQTVEAIRRHIVEGDLYEMNLCQEFYAEDCFLDPGDVFQQLNQLAQAPFAAFLKLHDRHLLCASPERFLKKEGDTLISQPIKGTIGRGATAAEDEALRQELYRSEKDRAENVMIVDLVRNDLARSCRPGSVEVGELFGIYPFNQVYQMISTVKGRLRPEVHPLDALRLAFPMGSMTGAPKVMAMQLIEQYERARRGLYSGAVGYLRPDGNFDFNVVIRSLLYHAGQRYLSFQVGGAIVYDSVPEREYEECLLKAKALLKVLGQSIEKPSVRKSSQKVG